MPFTYAVTLLVVQLVCTKTGSCRLPDNGTTKATAARLSYASPAWEDTEKVEQPTVLDASVEKSPVCSSPGSYLYEPDRWSNRGHGCRNSSPHQHVQGMPLIDQGQSRWSCPGYQGHDNEGDASPTKPFVSQKTVARAGEPSSSLPQKGGKSIAESCKDPRVCNESDGGSQHSFDRGSKELCRSRSKGGSSKGLDNCYSPPPTQATAGCCPGTAPSAQPACHRSMAGGIPTGSSSPCSATSYAYSIANTAPCSTTPSGQFTHTPTAWPITCCDEHSNESHLRISWHTSSCTGFDPPPTVARLLHCHLPRKGT